MKANAELLGHLLLPAILLFVGWMLLKPIGLWPAVGVCFVALGFVLLYKD